MFFPRLHTISRVVQRQSLIVTLFLGLSLVANGAFAQIRPVDGAGGGVPGGSTGGGSTGGGSTDGGGGSTGGGVFYDPQNALFELELVPSAPSVAVSRIDAIMDAKLGDGSRIELSLSDEDSIETKLCSDEVNDSSDLAEVAYSSNLSLNGIFDSVNTTSLTETTCFASAFSTGGATTPAVADLYASTFSSASATYELKLPAGKSISDLENTKLILIGFVEVVGRETSGYFAASSFNPGGSINVEQSGSHLTYTNLNREDGGESIFLSGVHNVNVQVIKEVGFYDLLPVGTSVSAGIPQEINFYDADLGAKTSFKVYAFANPN